MAEVFIEIAPISQEKNIFHTHGVTKHLNLNLKKATNHEYFKKITLVDENLETRKIFQSQVLTPF